MHAADKPAVADRGLRGRKTLYRQHVAHHGIHVVKPDVGYLGGRVIVEELVHHPANAAANADTVPGRALLQHGHGRSNAVNADFSISFAGAGAQPHAIAVTAPNGGVAQHFAAASTAAAEVKELVHHITNRSGDVELGPVGAALKHRRGRAHRIHPNNAVARAGTGAQTHAVPVVAGYHGGAFTAATATAAV